MGVDYIILGLATAFLSFGVFGYVRTRLKLSKIHREGAPLVEDGWNTFRYEPEYEDLYIDMRNEAFGRFCRIGIYGVVGIALAFGFDLKHDAFAFLLDLK
jgi:hypothetical protein